MQKILGIWENVKVRFSFPWPLLGMVIALLLVATISRVGPTIVTISIAAVVILVVTALLEQYEFLAILTIGVAIYVDWYLIFRVFALITALLLLVVLYLIRSSRHPWAAPRALWLWFVFLTITIYPTIEGALTIHDLSIYYPGVICGAFVMSWVGAVVAHDSVSVRRFFHLLSILGALVALHAIIQAVTGVFLFSLIRGEGFLTGLPITANIIGLGSVLRFPGFFLDPNWNGAFFTTMLFIPLGIFVTTNSLFGKVFYLVEAFLLLVALLLTLSAGSMIAAGGGLLLFIILAKGLRYRVQIIVGTFIAITVLLVGFSSQVNLLLQHGSDPSELMLRNGGWETALRVVQAYPLTGIGLGHLAYLERAEPFRLLAQSMPQDQPHNSYLEIAAMAGLPVLFVFLALLLFALWRTLKIWWQADADTGTLLGAGTAAIIALSINSWSINAWTLPPLAMIGWMVLGVISSPLLAKSLNGGCEITA
jgi:O-antigen ligase